MEKRLHYFDILKGLLIMGVVFCHIPALVNDFMGIPNDVYATTRMVAYNTIVPILMPAFFIATGYYGKYNMPWHVFLMKNAKTLLLPCFIFHILETMFLDGILLRNVWKSLYETVMGGGYWFLLSLFLAKSLYRIVQEIPFSTGCQRTLALGLSFIGCCYSQTEMPNILSFTQGLALMPFLMMGEWLRGKSYHEQRLPWWHDALLAMTYIALILIQLIFNEKAPAVTGILRVRMQDFPLFILSAGIGSLLLIRCCVRICECSGLEFIGRLSMGIYLSNLIVLCIIGKMLKEAVVQYSDNPFISAGLLLLTFLLAILACTACAWILNKKGCRILLGNF